MVTKTSKTKLEAIHTAAIKRFDIVESRERDQRKLAIQDELFANAESGQWDDGQEKSPDRPRFTINKVAGAIDQLVGDQRQNRTSIKVRPVSGGANEDTADIFNGLIRNIETQSKAANAYDAAYDEAVTGGYGGWRIITVFPDDSMQQEIKLKGIKSAASSLWFGPSEEYDKRDAKYAFLTLDMPLDEFKDTYPNATIVDFDSTTMHSSCNNWFRDNVVRVAEYWVKEETTIKLGELSDGRTIDLDAEAQVIDELAQGTPATATTPAKPPVTVVAEREAKTHNVVMYKISGGEVLEGPNPWAGKFIPLIPVFGKVKHIQSKEYVRGIVRFAKDPNRIYNYATSAAIEATALTPTDPYWLTKTQAAGFKKQFEEFPKRNQPFMFYNEDASSPGPPKRTGAPSVQTALIQQIQQAGMDIHATTGLEPASMGNSPELKSGKAIIAQQAMGDRGSFVFTDNSEKSKQYTGVQLVDLIPKIYDRPQTVRILNLDGSSEDKDINQKTENVLGQPVLDEQTGEVIQVNDLSLGKYDVTADTGPSHATKRQESVTQLLEFMKVSPNSEPLIKDLVAKNLDINEGDELHKRLRDAGIAQGIIEPTPEEAAEIQQKQQGQEQKPDPNMLIAQAEMLKGQAELQTAQVKQQQLQIDTQEKQIKLQNDQVKLAQAQQNLQTSQAKAASDIESRKLNDTLALMKQIEAQPQLAADLIKTHAQSMKLIREAQGIDTFTGPGGQQAFIQQGQEILDVQEEQL